jgi:hypothetical protein
MAWSFSCEILVLGISHLPMTTPKSTISEPYKHLRIWYGESVVFGCGQFRTFRPGLGFGQRYHVDRHGQLAPKQLTLSVLNEMHTNSYTVLCFYYLTRCTKFTLWLTHENCMDLLALRNGGLELPNGRLIQSFLLSSFCRPDVDYWNHRRESLLTLQFSSSANTRYRRRNEVKSAAYHCGIFAITGRQYKDHLQCRSSSEKNVTSLDSGSLSNVH